MKIAFKQQQISSSRKMKVNILLPLVLKNQAPLKNLKSSHYVSTILTDNTLAPGTLGSVFMMRTAERAGQQHCISGLSIESGTFSARGVY